MSKVVVHHKKTTFTIKVKFCTNSVLIATVVRTTYGLQQFAKIRAVKVDYFVVLPVLERFVMRHNLGHSM